MQIPKDLHNSITARYGTLLDLKANPEILQEIFATMSAHAGSDPMQPQGAPQSSPFGVSWMDSWVAHWVVQEKVQSAQARDAQFAAVLKDLVDLRFQARIAEIRRFIRDFAFLEPPPDGGTPEPGVPPAPRAPGRHRRPSRHRLRVQLSFSSHPTEGRRSPARHRPDQTPDSCATTRGSSIGSCRSELRRYST